MSRKFGWENLVKLERMSESTSSSMFDCVGSLEKSRFIELETIRKPSLNDCIGLPEKSSRFSSQLMPPHAFIPPSNWAAVEGGFQGGLGVFLS